MAVPLSNHSSFKDVGPTYFTVTWNDTFDVNDTVVGYEVRIRNDDEMDWSVVGFVRASSPLEFTVTRLSPDTSYLVMIAPVTDDPNSGILPGLTRRVNTTAVGEYLCRIVCILNKVFSTCGA